MDIKNIDFKKTIILDGAMGTMLQKYISPEEWCAPEIYNITKPELIEKIHGEYVDAGADIIFTNTFGANRNKLPNGVGVELVVKEGVRIAKKVADGKALVALDIGSIGELIEPMGELTFDEAVDIFKEVIISGVKEGVDIIAFETFTDLFELKAGIIAAKEVSNLPIFATMTFENNLKTFVGVSIEAMAITLEALGVTAMGINCSLSPDELYDHVKLLCSKTSLPIIIKANNGLPNMEGEFPDSAESFLTHYSAFCEVGVNIFGGCCGTSPKHIARLCELKKAIPTTKETHEYVRICSDSIVVDGNGIRVIGERLNPTGKKLLKKALVDEDFNYIFKQAIDQIDAGADILDVNCGVAEVNEVALLPKLIKKLQSITKIPLQIDSVCPEAVEKACRYYNGKPIINSINGSVESMNAIFPIAKKYGAAIVALAMNSLLPKSKEERIAEIKKIIKEAAKYKIPKKDIIADCLTLTVAGEQAQAMETLDAVCMARKLGVSATLGVSNISFGMPLREQFTATFLAEALSKGLNFPIINPNSYAVMNAILCHKVLTGEDENSLKYIAFSKNYEAKSVITQTKIVIDAEKVTESKKGMAEILESPIRKGLKGEANKRIEELLMTHSPLEVISEGLIPVLDSLGEDYASGKIFLPELILSSETAKALFENISNRLPDKERADGVKKILLATVKGDVHDIGKNLVKVVLQNYGYKVIDLGKNVDVDEICSTVKSQNIKLVGLSALMTTTAGYMQVVIDRLKQDADGVRVMIGGAVITQEYATKIGADYYAKNAIESVTVARAVLG